MPFDSRLSFCRLEVTVSMLTITDALVAEHRVFADLFDEIESLLCNVKTRVEVALLTSLVERLLQRHAEAEKDLAYAALDHALKHRGPVNRLHQDHEEIDESFRRAQIAPDFAEARRLLKTAIAASRKHFKREERSVFPLLEETLRPDTQAALGAAHIQPRAVPAR